jgi:hypothetical protein
MAEIKVSHLLVGLVLLAGIGGSVLVFVGILTVPALDIFGFKTPEINQKGLEKIVEKGTQTATGFTPAKTPTEAMDKFRDAIQARKYKSAAIYCTKPYAEQLERAADGATQLGEEIDRIEKYADNKGIKSEKLTYFLHQLDPFPKNFKAGPTPVDDPKDKSKAYGTYVFEKFAIKVRPIEMKEMDASMFMTTLRPPEVFGNMIELVKQGEAWKLNIPTNALFETRVGHFNQEWKTYHTGLRSLAEDLARETYTTKAGLEADVLAKLRAAKQR